ncbi:MAG: zinc ABC transporter substrate-binding protein [Aigarchaeota archaeon]|nr:zinc ABC transporter substrate-binding protein [Aigarchaeota archaeon]MDW8093296.1 zinc ABC transporter substrate-binding protein [Nitrososphaerota archaeon]
MYTKTSYGLIALALVVLTLNFFSGSLGEGESGDSDSRTVLATTTIIWDMARRVAGDLWVVEYLIEPGRDPHTFEPTPQDVIKSHRARLILYNGHAIDQWVIKLLRAGSKATFVRVTERLDDRIVLVPDGPYIGKPDPHMWMDVRLAIGYVERIRDAFIEIDPVNNLTYQENARKYIAQLLELDAWIREKVSVLPEEKKLLLTQENAFQYFARAYDFRVVGYFYSIVTEIEPSASDIVRVLSKVRESGLCVFFIETTLSPRVMEALAREVDGRIAGRLFTDSIPPLDTGLDGYIGMMRHNVETIVGGLREGC